MENFKIYKFQCWVGQVKVFGQDEDLTLPGEVSIEIECSAEYSSPGLKVTPRIRFDLLCCGDWPYIISRVPKLECSRCGGRLSFIVGVYPWSVDHWQCDVCDSTFCM
jgi:hypothetical protein